MYIDIFGDNEGVIAIANSASRSKHIDVKFHFIQGLVHTGAIQIIHVGTESQHADILTKALWRKTFVIHRSTALMDLA